MWKRTLKNTGLSVLRAGGLFSVAANSAHRRNRLLILCYHGLSLQDEHEWLGNLFMPAERFRQRLAQLRSFGANVLPLDEAVVRLRKRSLPPRSVAITFDDGFSDFLVHAVPALQEFHYPCTLYLTTHYCYYPMPIFNLAVEYVLWKSGRDSVSGLPALGLEKEMPVTTYEARQAVKSAMLRQSEVLRLDTAGKNDMVRCLAEAVRVDYDALMKSRMLQLLSPEEVGRTARAGVDIQLHTHRHRTPRDRALFLREIRDNAACIKELTGREPAHFCYPSGDYAMEFLPWLRECGVASATTCRPGLSRPQSEPLLLPRLLDDVFVNDLDFESYLCGLRW